ncbi:MAG: HAD family hydrolase [Chloroflexi bacterium]|nr:HAD family hydrolase [Chloroflexota bacterium]
MSVELGPLAGHRLVVFDKDGTLIDFTAMWGGWAIGLADRLEAATDRPIRGPLYEAFGIDGVSGQILPHGLLAATSMAVLRGVALDLLEVGGTTRSRATAVLEEAWRPPDPVALARPLADLGALFEALRSAGARIGIATSDDRGPTLRTLDALGIAGLVDAIVCADDGVAVKPAPDMIVELCRVVGVPATETAIVGDTIADLRMGRAAGVRTCVGVLSGSGTADELRAMADILIPSIAVLTRGPVAPLRRAADVRPQ